jgi:hypothetical protein
MRAVPPTIWTEEEEETFVAENPVLLDGEWAFAKDTLNLKLGDGLTAWNDLHGRGEPLLTSVVGVPRTVCALYNPDLSYTPRSFFLGGSPGNMNAIDFGDSALYRVTNNDVSISFFIKVTSVAGNQVLLGRGSYSGNVGYYFQLNAGYLELFHGSTIVLRVKAVNFVDRWVHLVLTKTASGPWRMYKNGGECTYLTQTSGNPATCDLSFRFGSSEGYTTYYTGSLSELRFFSKALSQEEITALYLGDDEVAVANLVGWWKCNEEPYDEYAHDSSTSEIDGVLEGETQNDLFFTSVSPFTKVQLSGIFRKYVACLGGFITNPASPFIGTEIPDFGVDADIIWAWKIIP